MAENEREWVIAPDTAKIDIAIGPDARLSPELRSALDELARVLADEGEVQGHAMRQPTWNCGVVTITECAVLISCSAVGIR